MSSVFEALSVRGVGQLQAFIRWSRLWRTPTSLNAHKTSVRFVSMIELMNLQWALDSE